MLSFASHNLVRQLARRQLQHWPIYMDGASSGVLSRKYFMNTGLYRRDRLLKMGLEVNRCLAPTEGPPARKFFISRKTTMHSFAFLPRALRNMHYPLRANLVADAKSWPYGSLYRWSQPGLLKIRYCKSYWIAHLFFRFA